MTATNILIFGAGYSGQAFARALPAGDIRRTVLLESAERHLQSALPHVAGDYMGEHWLATFATLALEA